MTPGPYPKATNPTGVQRQTPSWQGFLVGVEVLPKNLDCAGVHTGEYSQLLESNLFLP